MNIQKIACDGHMYALVPFALLQQSERTFSNLNAMAMHMGFKNLPLKEVILNTALLEKIRSENKFMTHIAFSEVFPYSSEDEESEAGDGFALVVYGGETNDKPPSIVTETLGEEKRIRIHMRISILPTDLVLNETFDTTVCIFLQDN